MAAAAAAAVAAQAAAGPYSPQRPAGPAANAGGGYLHPAASASPQHAAHAYPGHWAYGPQGSPAPTQAYGGGMMQQGGWGAPPAAAMQQRFLAGMMADSNMPGFDF